MSEMISQSKCPFWPWTKGAHLWGEPLPYGVTEGAEEYVMCGAWWNRDRVVKLLDWQAQAMHHLLRVCGDDRQQRLRGVAQVHAERAERMEAIAGKRLNMRDLFNEWRPDAQEAARIEDLASGYIRVRDDVRAGLVGARVGHAELREELGENPEEWTAVHMAAALMRLPRMLRGLIAKGEVPDPGELMPAKAEA